MITECKAKEQVEEVVKNTQLGMEICFPCPVYFIKRPDFLETVNAVSEEYLEKNRKETDLNEIYPHRMTNNYYDDPRLKDFCEFVGGTAWNILNEQGYVMDDKLTQFHEMWTQEHHKHSLMEQHVHGYGAQIVGFYFLEVPEDSSKIVFHDPRAGKVQVDLPQRDVQNVTISSYMVNYAPKPGLMMFTNAWMAHSFSRHAADKPLKFVHFNVGVVQNMTPAAPPAEVI